MPIKPIIVELDIPNEQVKSDFAASLASQPDVHLRTAEMSELADLMVVEADMDRARTLAQVNMCLTNLPAAEIFLTSSQSDVDLVLDAYRAGVKEFIRQPVDKVELEQALERFRKRRQTMGIPLAKAGRLINVMGSKGGIGTTTIAVNLAISLQQVDPHQSVVVVDVNQPFGDVALFLDLDPQRTFSDIVRNVSDLDDAFIQGVLVEHTSGIQVLSASNADDESGRLTPECAEQTIELLQTLFDYVIVDSGHALNEITGAVLQIAAPLYIVTTLTLPVLRNTDRFIKIIKDELGYTNNDFRLIVNRYRSKKQEISLHDLEEIVKHKPFWSIPNDYDTASDAIYQGEPISAIARRAKITKSFREFAASLLTEGKGDS